MIRLCLAHNKQSIDGNSDNEDAFTTHDATVPLSWVCFPSRPQGNTVEASSVVSGIEMTFDLSYSKYLTDEIWEVHT